MGVLRLQLPTDPRWVIVEKNIEEILTDHAWCEQKRPLMQLQSLPTEHQDLVKDLLALAKEEIDHLNRCTIFIIKRFKIRARA
jgi:tRNA-(ms[2]io[6]A)-hydroxylase